MILDSLKNSALYYGVSPRMKQAFELIASTDWTTMEPGIHELDGKDIYRQPLGNGILCMGNEGRGLREETKRRVSCPLFIPPFPPNAPHPESLNVAIATAVALSQFRYGKEN